MRGTQGASSTNPLRVHLLGGFEIEGIDARALGSRKARTLLRRLAVGCGRPVGAAELAETVWGDEPPRDPADQLSVLVSRLRAVLGTGRLLRDDAGYRLLADWVDLVELQTRAAEAETRLAAGQLGSALAAAQAALAIVRGRLLPEDEGGWVAEARAAAERDVARARLVAAEAALALGDTRTACTEASAALDADPWDEGALRMLMRADVAAGRQAAALVAFETVRARLADELGVDPAPQTRALHLAVLQGRVPATPPTATTGGLVGRREEWRRLDVALSQAARGVPQAVVVEGEPGIGKSALLRAWLASAASAALTVAGRCDELGRDLPLQPVVDGLAAHLRSLGRVEAAAVLGDDREVLDGVLGRRTGDLEAGVTTVAGSAAGRLALFGALAAAFERAAAGRPLLLAVDDLHAAAAGTLEFLAFVLRRLSRVAVVATRRRATGAPELPWTERVSLGPLCLEDAAELVGAERCGELHRRSGGNPLFLLELSRAPEGRLPASIVDAVAARVTALGDAATTLQAAAVLGPEVDADLLAAALHSPVPAVLDALEAAVTAGFLAARGDMLAFSHALVREAVEAATAPSRHVALHRTAALLLAARPGADPLLLAGHARLAGDPALAGYALVEAARRASERFEAGAAESLLDDAVAVADGAAARLARGRLRMGRLDLSGAREDVQRALDLGAGAQAFELAGWVEYYSRDYDAARRYADEGVRRGDDDATRASCLALGGRVRHTRGELADATTDLARAVELAPPAVRAVAQVWQAQLLVHTGRLEEGLETAQRALLDPHAAHPFAPLHGRYAVAMALGSAGRWAEAHHAVDEVDAVAARMGDRRFRAVAANLRGWLLRGAGLLEEACELHEWAAELERHPLLLEPHYAGLLDLCEDRLAAGDLAGAGEALERGAGVVKWEGTMAWRHRERHRLLRGWLALAGGDAGAAGALAEEVAAAAAERGVPRYVCRARILAATAGARSGRAPAGDALAPVIERFQSLAGPDGWRDLARLAAATGCERWRQVAETLAARVAEGARRCPGIDAERVAARLRAALEGAWP